MFLSLFSSTSNAETVDCDMVKSDSIVGMYDKWKCNRGKPREKKEGSKILQKIKNKLKKN